MRASKIVPILTAFIAVSAFAGGKLNNKDYHSSQTFSGSTQYQARNQVRFEVYPGSLKANVTRIANLNGWHKVIWTMPYDYKWVASETRFVAPSLAQGFEQLLAPYPVQAIFYKGNHVLVLKARNVG